MKPLFFTSVFAPTLVAGGVFAPGVKDVSVTFRNEAANVTFDGARTTVAALTDATFEMGCPPRRFSAGSAIYFRNGDSNG